MEAAIIPLDTVSIVWRAACRVEGSQWGVRITLSSALSGWSTGNGSCSKTSSPAPAIRLLLERTGLKLDDIARFEVNEAQGAQTLAVGRELGMDLSKLNVNGGAIALGHPIGASGARIVVTLLGALRQQGKKKGVAALCIGGGEATALAVEML